jgi:hypothetical protein
MQRNLFPGFAEDLGPTTDKHLRVIVALDMIEVEKFTFYQSPFAVGRLPVNRNAIVSRQRLNGLLTSGRDVPLIQRCNATLTPYHRGHGNNDQKSALACLKRITAIGGTYFLRIRVDKSIIFDEGGSFLGM